MRRRIASLTVVAGLALALAAARLQGQAQTPAQRFQHAVQLLEAQGDADGAVRLLQPLVAGPDRDLAARSLFYIGLAWEKHDVARARQAYERLLREFTDRPDAVARARARLATLRKPAGRPHTRSLSAHPVGEEPFPPLGRPSADGRLFPVLSPTEGTLAVYDTVTGQRLVLAKDPRGSGGVRSAAVSPDGRQIAFTWDEGESVSELRVSPVDRWAPRTLARFDAFAVLGFSWSPDGSRLAAALEGRGSGRLATISLADGALRVEREFADGGPFVADWSPDGRWLAYDRGSSEDPTNLDVYVFDLATGEEHHVVKHPAQETGPLWTSDGLALAFFSDRTGSVSAWLQPVAAGEPRGPAKILQPYLGRSRPIHLTPGGTLYYERQQGLVDVYTVPFDPAKARIAGDPVSALPRESGSNNTCAWSPDGRHLALVRSLAWSTGRSSTIVVRQADGPVVRELSPHMRGFLTLGWSPDGRELLTKGYSARKEYGYFRIDAATAAVTPVLTVPPNEESAYGRGIWAPDGQAILYNGPRGIVRHDLSTGGEQLWQAAGEGESLSNTWFRFSPDGRSFAFVTQRQEGSRTLRSLRVRGVDGRVSEVFRAPARDFRGLEAWTPDGKWLLIVRLPEGALPHEGWVGELWAVPAGGGDPRPTGLAMPQLRGVNVSRDGRRLAFTSGNPTWELWAIENLLPAAPRRDRPSRRPR